MDRLIELLNAKVAAMDVTRPWAMDGAAELDAISFKNWLKAHSDKQEAIDNVSIYIASGMLTKPAHTFSALQAILMAALACSRFRCSWSNTSARSLFELPRPANYLGNPGCRHGRCPQRSCRRRSQRRTQ